MRSGVGLSAVRAATLCSAVLLASPVAAAFQDAAEIPIRDDGSLVAADSAFRVESRTLEIENFGFVEYKFRLEQGQTMVYTWRASSPVRSEMHSQDDTAPPGTADFFEIVPEATEGHGAYTAPYTGIHGWYWENLDIGDPVTVTITAAGFFSLAQEFRRGGVTDYEVREGWTVLAPVAAQPE